jgi:protein-disulfide isomerase
MREIWIALVVAITAAGALLAPPAAAQTQPPTPEAAQLLAVTPQDRVLGQPDAPITIIEYSSLTCSHCANFDRDVLPPLKENWIDTGKAKLVMRAFPLDEPALRAEMVARCAPPERYFPLIHTMFETQGTWAFTADWRGALERIARLGGISKKDFDACLANQAVEDEVLQSRLTAATQLGVNSTPTFFINGTKFEGAPTAEAFERMLSGLAPRL